MRKYRLILVSVALAMAGVVSASAGPLRPDEARRFVAGKLFSYTCFDGTRGVGRIHADGSVLGTIQARGGSPRFVAMPTGTIRLSSTSICASLRGALFQPCFDVVQTSNISFRGSISGLGFAYCDFVRRDPRQDLNGPRRAAPVNAKPARAEPVSISAVPKAEPIPAAVAAAADKE
jgi:hypothetical protein